MFDHLSKFFTAYNLFSGVINPNFIFCIVKDITINKFTDLNLTNNSNSLIVCEHFEGDLNTRCINYFQENKFIDEKCGIYFSPEITEIEKDEEYLKLHGKWYNFLDFMLEHDKVYDTLENIITRFEIFHENMGFINEQNSLNMTYSLGVTKFADYTHSEYLEFISYGRNHIQKNICTDAEPVTGFYAAAIDWRQKNIVTPVKDQGNCGSCWAFSTTGAMEGLHAIQSGNLISLSEQQLIDCSHSYGNHGCNGGMMQNAFTYVIDHGLTSEMNYPYTASDEKNGCDEFEPIAHASECFNIPANEEQLTFAVSKQPVSVAIQADSRSFQLYKSGVYNDPSCGTNLDHGVLVVGYGTDEGKDYWIVKNSWSEKWGEDGYIRIARNSKFDSIHGMCGIAMEASMPILSNDKIVNEMINQMGHYVNNDLTEALNHISTFINTDINKIVEEHVHRTIQNMDINGILYETIQSSNYHENDEHEEDEYSEEHDTDEHDTDEHDAAEHDEALLEHDAAEHDAALLEHDAAEHDAALPEHDAALPEHDEALPEHDAAEHDEALPEHDAAEHDEALPEHDAAEHDAAEHYEHLEDLVYDENFENSFIPSDAEHVPVEAPIPFESFDGSNEGKIIPVDQI